ncbi:MAG: hypothetical protein AAGF58_15315 [Pseudomonadota bacterium]
MGYTVTLSILGVALVIFLVANIISRRPPPLGEVRLIPYGAVQFVALVVVFLMLAHLITLFTGKPFEGRRSLF